MGLEKRKSFTKAKQRGIYKRKVKAGKDLTFQLHANLETLLEAAVGTPFALRLIDGAVPILYARIDLLVLHCPLEEPLAGLAGEQAIVVAGDLVAADRTLLVQLRLDVRLVEVEVHPERRCCWQGQKR